MSDHDVMTIEEAAAFLKMGRSTLYRALARNQVPHRRIGKNIRFSRSALILWLGSWSSQGAQKGRQ